MNQFLEEEDCNMLNLEVTTKLPQEEVSKRAMGFFGKGGLGLEAAEKDSQCLSFEGGGGYVTVTTCAEGDKTKVTMVTQEWEYQIKEFASSLS
jgi:hypothetical protein